AMGDTDDAAKADAAVRETDDAADPGAENAAPAAVPRVAPASVQPAKSKAAKPLLSVLIDYQTLLGDLRGNGICELFDGTPISPDTVRRLACDAAIIPMVLGSRGEVLNQGRRIYQPTMPQRHAIAIRDRHCAFPGCRR